MGVGGSSRGGTSNKKLLNMETVLLKLATIKLLRGGWVGQIPSVTLVTFLVVKRSPCMLDYNIKHRSSTWCQKPGELRRRHGPSRCMTWSALWTIPWKHWRHTRCWLLHELNRKCYKFHKSYKCTNATNSTNATHATNATNFTNPTNATNSTNPTNMPGKHGQNPRNSQVSPS